MFHAAAPRRVVRALPVAQPGVWALVVGQHPQPEVARRRDARHAATVGSDPMDCRADAGCRVHAPSRADERPGIQLQSQLRATDAGASERRRGEDPGNGRAHAHHVDRHVAVVGAQPRVCGRIRQFRRLWTTRRANATARPRGRHAGRPTEVTACRARSLAVRAGWPHGRGRGRAERRPISRSDPKRSPRWPGRTGS